MRGWWEDGVCLSPTGVFAERVPVYAIFPVCVSKHDVESSFQLIPKQRSPLSLASFALNECCVEARIRGTLEIYIMSRASMSER